MNLKARIEKNTLFWVLIFISVGFGSGIGFYKLILEISNQTTITKDSYISIDKLNKEYILISECNSLDDNQNTEIINNVSQKREEDISKFDKTNKNILQYIDGLQKCLDEANEKEDLNFEIWKNKCANYFKLIDNCDSNYTFHIEFIRIITIENSQPEFADKIAIKEGKKFIADKISLLKQLNNIN